MFLIHLLFVYVDAIFAKNPDPRQRSCRLGSHSDPDTWKVPEGPSACCQGHQVVERESGAVDQEERHTGKRICRVLCPGLL